MTETAPTPSAAARLLARLSQLPSLLLTLTAILWAGNAVASRIAVGNISPYLLVFLRWVVVLAVLLPLHGKQVREHWPVIRLQLGKITFMAFFGFTAFNALFYVAGYYTSAINIGILQGSIPVIVLLGAFLIYGTRATWVQIAGVLITTVGVLVVATHGKPLSILEIGLNRGDLAMLFACVLYAFYTIALRDRPSMPGTTFFTLMAIIAAITSVPLLAVEAMTTGLVMPTWQGWLVVLYVAIFPSYLAQICYVRGVDLIGPGRAGVFVNLVPVFAAILAVALINEPFATFHAVALVLVIGGIWLAQRTASG